MYMKFLLTGLLACLFALTISAQDTTTVAADTTIYQFADETPRFPTPCERYDTTAAAKAECAQVGLLDYIYKRVLYPQEARENGTSGTAVVSFIVEANGIVNRPEVLRDPGDDLGNAALLAVYAMQREYRWRPAVKDGKPVRFRFILPIRFRLEEPKPYVVSGRDTIYTSLTRAVQFTGVEGSLTEYFDKKLRYPESGEDSCRTGQLDIQLLVEPNGLVRVQDIIDYNDLGLDFTSHAIDVATSSYGQWSPGEFEGRKVLAAYDVSVTFAPKSAGCASTVQRYNEAVQLMNEGQVLAQDTTTLEAGLLKMGRAVDDFPRDGRFRILRGQSYLDNNRLGDACGDLRLAKEIALIDWYDAVLPVICRE